MVLQGLWAGSTLRGGWSNGARSRYLTVTLFILRGRHLTTSLTDCHDEDDSEVDDKERPLLFQFRC